MSDYYVYNGRLYSSDELKHFRLGWIKPDHKWITRKKKNGKWIYTYNKGLNSSAKITDVYVYEDPNKLLDEAKLYGDENKALNIELDNLLKQTGRANGRVDYEKVARINELRSKIEKNRKTQERLYARANTEGRTKAKAITNDPIYKEKLEKKQKKIRREQAIKRGIEFIASGKIVEMLKHPLDKEARDKAVKKAEEVYKAKQKQKRQEELKKKRAAEEAEQKKKQRDESERKAKEEQKRRQKEEERRRKEEETKLRNKPVNDLKKNPNKIKGLNIQSEGHTSEENSGAVNPNYLKAAKAGSDSALYKEYGMNCSNCSVAYDMRMRGYDVQAKGRSETNNILGYAGTDSINDIEKMYDGNATKRGVKDIAIVYDQPINEESKELLNNSKSSKVDKKYQTWADKSIDNKKYINNLEQEMLKGGNGSRGIFQCYWVENGHYTGSGHSMAYEVRNNKVVIVDAQVNREYSLDQFYEVSTGASFMRTDNLEPNDKIKQKIKNS